MGPARIKAFERRASIFVSTIMFCVFDNEIVARRENFVLAKLRHKECILCWFIHLKSQSSPCNSATQLPNIMPLQNRGRLIFGPGFHHGASTMSDCC